MSDAVSNTNNLNQVIIEGKVTHSLGSTLALKVRKDLTVHFGCSIDNYSIQDRLYKALVGQDGIRVEGSLERKNLYKKSEYWIDAIKVSNNEGKVFFERESK